MTISADVIFSDGTKGDMFVAGQRFAVDTVGALARQHGFKILNGRWPVFIQPSQFDEFRAEWAIVHDAGRRGIKGRADFSEDDSRYHIERWDRIAAFFDGLRGRDDWELMIG